MADFTPAYVFMVPHEVINYHQPGQIWFTNTPGDHGGKTAWGITEATARDHGYNDSMETMLEMDAIQIYKKIFKPFAVIDSQRVASKMFDAAVNMGVSRAVKQAQRALGFPEAEWDGVLGPKTLGAINAKEPGIFLADYAAQLVSRYHAIVAKDPTQERFLKGWTRRALELPPED